MKRTILTLTLLSAIPLSAIACGPCGCRAPKPKKETTATHDHGHDHSHDEIVGPNGGKILHGVDPHVEFFLTEERKVQLTFVNEEGGVVSVPEGLQVSVITGDRKAPTTLRFAQEGSSLISTGTVPEGDDLPVVVQIKPSEDAQTVYERFNLSSED
ncbi:MAG: hypothetical protein AAF555_01720 [Verrucomicrobiota bacterium]